MLLELQGSVNPRQNNLLGYSRHLSDAKKGVPSAASGAAPGQFDDADDMDGDNLSPVLENQTQQSSEPRQIVSRNEVSPEHPLKWLVAAACDRTNEGQCRKGNKEPTGPSTPRRVSLGGDHPPVRLNSSGFVATETPEENLSREDSSSSESALSRVSSSSFDSNCQSLETRLGIADKKQSKAFEEYYRELLDFRKLHGHADVLTRGEYTGLGRWLSDLRCKSRSGALPADQSKLLRDLGCIGFDDLKDEDRPIVPNSYATPVGTTKETPKDSQDTSSDPKTGAWRIRPGYKHTLPALGSYHHPAPRMVLVPHGPPPCHPVHFGSHHMPRPPMDPSLQDDNDDWHYGMRQLEDFFQEYGHVNVSTTLVATNKKEHHMLSLWLASKRHMHRKGQLPRERAHVLHSYFGCPGFEPSAAPAAESAPVPPESAFVHHPYPAAAMPHPRPDAPGYHPIVRPVLHHHHNRPPARKTTLHSVEAIHNKVSSQNQVEAINPNTGKPVKKRGQYIGWHDRLEQLVAFRKKNGHADVRIMMHDDCKELGRWLASQRHQYRKGKLPKDKVKILQNLGVNLEYKKPPALGSY